MVVNMNHQYYYICMLKRKIDDMLRAWKTRRGNECLLVNGARQVGKTFSIRQFGKECYKEFLEINFIENPLMVSVFDHALDSDSVIRQLRLRIPDFNLIEGDTLIFLDEIQNCPNARTALKFLGTDHRFDVVASGSLITLLSQDVHSLPVGYEKEIMMYPLSFEEYLWARGYSEEVAEVLAEAFSEPAILDKGLISQYNSLLTEYMIVGGMPAAVTASLENNSWNEVRNVQNNILRLNLQDIEKYSKGLEREKIQLALDGVIRQAGDGKKAFSYAQIEKGKSRARDYMTAVEWLQKAQLIYPSNSLANIDIPLSMYTQEKTARFYFYDIGMFYNMVAGDSQLLRNAIMNNDWKGPAKGRFYEALAADLLHKNGHKLYYYDIPQKMEIDFIIETDKAVLPIEIKSGNNKALSLSKLMTSSDIPIAVKFTEASSGKADRIITLPLFMAAFIGRDTYSAT